MCSCAACKICGAGGILPLCLCGIDWKLTMQFHITLL